MFRPPLEAHPNVISWHRLDAWSRNFNEIEPLVSKALTQRYFTTSILVNLPSLGPFPNPSFLSYFPEGKRRKAEDMNIMRPARSWIR